MSNLKKKCIQDYDRLIGDDGFAKKTRLTIDMKNLIRDIQKVTHSEIGQTVLFHNSGFQATADSEVLDKAVRKMKDDLKKNRVLISVSSKSVDRVKPLKDYLEYNGVSTFLYDGAIKSGQKFQDKILNTINDVDLVICFIDEHYLSSDFSMVEFIYSFVEKDVDQCVWIDSEVKNKVFSKIKEKSCSGMSLFDFIIGSIQFSEINNKNDIINDLKRINELSCVDFTVLNPFDEVYNHLIGK